MWDMTAEQEKKEIKENLNTTELAVFSSTLRVKDDSLFIYFYTLLY